MLQADSSRIDNIPKRRNWRTYWIRTMVQWHWISSALCLIGMVLFAFTGITLNHAGQIESQPVVERLEGTVPADLLSPLRAEAERIADAGKSGSKPSAISNNVAQWLKTELGVSVLGAPVEWSSDEVYVSLARPGQDAWVSIDLATGLVETERTWRGWIAYLNDLHKGRHAGIGWTWFLDIFSVATLVFCFTGLMLLIVHAKRRKMTWPLVSLGFIIPALVAILLIH